MRVGFLSLDNSQDAWAIYDGLLVEPFQRRGVVVDKAIPWRDYAKIDFSVYDVVVVRSTWDYQEDLDLFFRALTSIAGTEGVALENSLPTMRWNASKTYLRDLVRRRISIVPTAFVEVGAAAPDDGKTFTRPSDALRAALAVFDEVVVKPAVGASSFDTFRVARSALDEPFEFVEDRVVRELRGRDTTFGPTVKGGSTRFENMGDFVDAVFHYPSDSPRACLVQPYVPTIATEGEWSLFFFNGALSHAMRKVPKPGDFRVQEEFGATHTLVDPETLSTGIAACCEACIAAIAAQGLGTPLYARFDIVHVPAPILELATAGASSPFFCAGCDDANAGAFAVMEVELIEPSLYFNLVAAATETFCDAFLARHPLKPRA
ncbi:Cycloserine biosynthesis protein DcsG [Diplonema papillatum]|nr:Cycloserine biosynthesis protein DcsG [Diplonema papillatum]